MVQPKRNHIYNPVDPCPTTSHSGSVGKAGNFQSRVGRNETQAWYYLIFISFFFLLNGVTNIFWAPWSKPTGIFLDIILPLTANKILKYSQFTTPF